MSVPVLVRPSTARAPQSVGGRAAVRMPPRLRSALLFTTRLKLRSPAIDTTFTTFPSNGIGRTKSGQIFVNSQVYLWCFGDFESPSLEPADFTQDCDGMVLARQRGALLRPRLVLLVIIALHTAAADVIFRVPEVLVRHAAASKPVGTGRTNTSRAVESDRLTSDDNLLEVNYEEYFIEHEISTADAKRAAARLQLDQVPSTRAGCGTCSRRELEYCETRVLADHCCCERHFLPEPFPWLPHTCYLGPNRCKPLAHDCARYARLRDCCCYRRLAERWKGILSASAPLHSTPSLPLCLMLLALPFLTM